MKPAAARGRRIHRFVGERVAAAASRLTSWPDQWSLERNYLKPRRRGGVAQLFDMGMHHAAYTTERDNKADTAIKTQEAR